MYISFLTVIACVLAHCCFAQTAEWYLPVQGSGGIVDSCAGVLKDSGGDGVYVDNSDGYLTVGSSDGGVLTLSFDVFNVELGFDFVEIYDGPSLSFERIGRYSGQTLEGQTLQTTQNFATIRLISDDIVTNSGFVMRWTCEFLNVESLAQRSWGYYNASNQALYVDAAFISSGDRILIYDLSGKVVYQAELSEGLNVIPFYTSFYNLYVVHILTHGGQAYSFKFISATP